MEIPEDNLPGLFQDNRAQRKLRCNPAVAPLDPGRRIVAGHFSLDNATIYV
jgi:hypothetical protein